MSDRAQGAGRYLVAYWREAGAYENQAPPAGQTGNHSAFVHVWDDQGQPLSGKQIYTSWGVLLGTTDANGYADIELRRPNGYDFQIRDGAYTTETTPILSVERAPTWGYYSFEIGFMLKRDASAPGRFDTNHLGQLNATGIDPCLHLQAPHTRSLAYYSTAASNYCSDAYSLGQWTTTHGQGFVANGNRVIAAKAFMAAGYLNHLYWTAQIREDGPGGTPIGPPRSTRVHADGEYWGILAKWGANDVQVVPGRTYFLEITRPEGMNVYRVNRNNYPEGGYFENGMEVPGLEMMGLVVCGSWTNLGGTLTGQVRNSAGQAMRGVVVQVPDTGLYTTSDAQGGFMLPHIPPGKFDVQASKSGHITALQTGLVFSVGLTVTSVFVLQPQTAVTNSGVVMATNRNLQPLEIAPAWSSSFDATWGGAATFDIAAGGASGNSLRVSRGGPGSSARVLVFPVVPQTEYQINVSARAPSSAASYWAECGYKLGSQTAESFDSDAGSWSLIKKFSNTGANGNGSIWTRYYVTLKTGVNKTLTVGFKSGASSGTGPVVQWDELAVVSLTLPGVTLAVADHSKQLRVYFDAPVQDATGSNPANFRLRTGNQWLAIPAVLFASNTQVVLDAVNLPMESNATLIVSNVLMVNQPGHLAGLNAQVPVRVPVPLMGPGEDTAWRFELAGGIPSGQWRTVSFDDTTWTPGSQPLGFSSAPVPFPLNTLLATNPIRSTYYFRTRLQLPALITNAYLRLELLVDDGVVCHLNGAELLRLGMSSGAVYHNTAAARTVGIAAWEGPFDIARALLAGGTNVLAVEVHQSDPASPDLVFAAAVSALVQPSEAALLRSGLSIRQSLDGFDLEWPAAGWQLWTATNLAGPWSVTSGAVSPLRVRATNETRFFRLGY